MIDLRKAVFYEFIDDGIVEIFDKYKWGLIRIGVDFSQELLDMIVSCSFDLENILIAFCGWILSRNDLGENLSGEVLKDTLMDALREGWIPTKYQQQCLNKNHAILESPQEMIWAAIATILGNNLRNKLILDVTNNREILFRNNLTLTVDECNRIAELKLYMAELEKKTMWSTYNRVSSSS